MTPEKPPPPVVLVVDDEALIRWALSEGLAESGYLVREAANGAEARAAMAASRAQPLVVVLDLRLPDVSDLSLLAEIRAARPDAPILMMTAHGTADHCAEALRLGARAFISKPFDVRDVVRQVGAIWHADRYPRLA
jgi:two-component system nitrogen regulation response regulator GlnG